MKTFNFNNIKSGQGRKDAIESGVCLVEFKGSGSRQVEDKCLLVNVTALSNDEVQSLVSELSLLWVDVPRSSEK